jgi:hypothetical protein
MLHDSKAILIVAASLIALAVASRLLILRDLPLRIHYDRLDNIAFRILFSLGMVAVFFGLLRALTRLRP